jgi:S1-C subfamily serine protease
MMDVTMPSFPMLPYEYLLYTEYEDLPSDPVKLGIMMKEKDNRVVVEDVVPGSAADKAGVLAGDVIVSLGGVMIEDSFDLIYEVKQRVSGDQSVLVVEREGAPFILDVIFTKLPKPENHK